MREGKRIFYRIKKNKDPALVFVHGFCGDHNDWSKQFEKFSKRYTTVSLDMIGHGRSDESDDYSLDSYASGVHAVVEAIGSRNVVLIGHSLGTIVISYYWKLYGDRVKGMVFVDGGAGSMTKEAYNEIVRQMKADEDSYFRKHFELMFFEKADPKLKSRLLKRWLSSNRKMMVPSLKASLLSWTQEATYEIAKTVDVPALIVYQASRFSPARKPPTFGSSMLFEKRKEAFEKFANCFKNSELRRVEDAPSHYFMIENPNLLNKPLSSFLNQIAIQR